MEDGAGFIGGGDVEGVTIGVFLGGKSGAVHFYLYGVGIVSAYRSVEQSCGVGLRKLDPIGLVRGIDSPIDAPESSVPNGELLVAVGGAEIEIPTLEKPKTLKIPKGTQYGESFVFKGEGIPSLRSGKRGDQIIQVDIKTPKRLSKKQEKLLKEFDKLDSDKISNKLRNLFKGI